MGQPLRQSEVGALITPMAGTRASNANIALSFIIVNECGSGGTVSQHLSLIGKED